MQAFWPGRLTLVFEAHKTLSRQLTAGSKKIGVRIPGHAVAVALVKKVGSPITGTSANISGHPGCHRVADLDPHIIKQVDMTLDGGTLESGVGSTVIVSCDVAPWEDLGAVIQLAASSTSMTSSIHKKVVQNSVKFMSSL